MHEHESADHLPSRPSVAIACHETSNYMHHTCMMCRMYVFVNFNLNANIQDWPGRTKLWHIGVPPSGPMDSFAFRLANALVGNDEGAAGLEITLSGEAQHT